MSFIERLTSLFAPDECLSCRREGSLLCSQCSSSLAPLANSCFSCFNQAAGIVCDDCLPQTGCTAMAAVTSYIGIGKQLVASLKFVGNQSAARVMAECMRELYLLPEKTIITHMPATTAHIRERGYDQAAMLAKNLARLTGKRHATLLARSGKKHQLGADRHQRLAQLRNALRVRQPALVQNRHILLIDDVLTTGASIRAATTVLLDAGAAQVDALVFAQALVPHLVVQQREGL